MQPSSVEGLPSVWDCDQPLETSQENATVQKNATVAGTDLHSMDTNDTVHVDNIHMGMVCTFPTRSHDEQFDAEFLIISDNEENNRGIEKSNNQDSNRGTKRKTITNEIDVGMLRKKITPELRTNKRLKKIHQQISHETSERDREMKKELHEIRMNILKKELEIKENQFFVEREINTERLKAAKVESETRVLLRQIMEAELDKLYTD
ncbi:uncharacterized protein [Temnothorax longispinosus]|uniref:uncharacterized protein n=1 Tax=Temnothorax longispinosus TaxID=300112 RepID=UPI003A99ACD6